MIRAVNDDVIVTIEYEDQSSGGIILPDGGKVYEGEFYGTVVSVGPGYKYGLNRGDKVMFIRHEGFEMEKDGARYLRLRKEWVLARVI